MTLLTPSFLKRLQQLRDRLSSVLYRFDFLRANPTGHMVTPETDSFRPYASGDDPRYIDWSIYARLGKYFVKTVVREDEGVIHLLVDSSGSMRSPHPVKHLRCLETAAGIGYLALMAGNRVVLHSFSDRLLMTHTYEQGDTVIHDYLKQLEAVPLGSESDLARTLSQLSGLEQGSSSRILIISDFIYQTPYWEKLNLIKAGGSHLAAIRIMHEREVKPRLRGHFQIRDPENGELISRLIGHRLQKDYRNRVQQHMHDTREIFHQANIPFLGVTTRTPFEDLVLDFFQLPSWHRWR